MNILGGISALLGLVLGVFSVEARADEFRSLFRGTRAQAMGNAFVAVADDEQAIFYNPAGLAGVERFSIRFATAEGDISNDTIASYSTLTNAMANPTASQVNNLIGKNFYFRGQGTFSLIGTGFGIAGIYDYQGALRLKNQALPQGILGLQNTYGGQIAFAKTIGRFKRKRAELRLGVAAKVLRRAGGYQTPTLTQLLTLSSSTITSQINNQGIGYGVDVGLQFVYPLGKMIKLMAGVVYNDIGDTYFQGGAESIRGNLAAGLALTYKRNEMTVTVAYDYKHILDNADWRKKQHAGFELKFPLLSFYGGISQLNLTFGAGVDLGIFKFMYTSYAEEQGSVNGQDPERRHLVQSSFKFDIF